MADQTAGRWSPQPPPTHLGTPKETHVAEVDHDTFTGNKVINTYEVLSEIGRGEHGKVKLGQDLLTGSHVAVKIVPRFSNKRRLGKLGAPEDRVKKEVAILKKARHPNVVSLLEVIDDPSKMKVYIVLEYVEHGEIRWRKTAPREITIINNRRLDLERHGREETAETIEQDMLILRRARMHRQRDSDQRTTFGRDLASVSRQEQPGAQGSDPQSPPIDQLSSSTDHSPNSAEATHLPSESCEWNPPPGSPYLRAKSVAGTSIPSCPSSQLWEDEEDESSYVPTLTLAEAKSAFRDTLLGLEFLHFQGIIHRDIKPANLLVTSDGHVKISDFGVSYLGKPLRDDEHDKLNDKMSEHEAQEMDDPRLLAKTVGTPAFYAPELIYWDTDIFEGGEAPVITGAVDLWALGVTLYCMIYGRLPFFGDGEGGLFRKIMSEEVLLPKQKLKPVDFGQDSRASSRVEVGQCCDNGHRAEHELIYEDVPDTVRDLIRSLLTKDPAHRITIERAKMHPWVVEGIEDPVRWIGDTDPKRHGEERISVSGEDLSYAVVKKTVLERAIDNVKVIAGNFMTKARKRATSAAPSATASLESVASTPGPSGSMVSRDRDGRLVRRPSIRADEIASMLKPSREGELHHPLAHSEIASPAEDLDDSYFDRDIANHEIKSLSAGCSPLPDADGPPSRPRGPERHYSAASTAESMKTVRAPPPRPGRSNLLGVGREGVESPSLLETTTASFGHLFSGASKHLSGMRSRERRPLDSSRSSSADGRSPQSKGHAQPSLAVSNAVASGKVTTPEALRPGANPVDEAPLPQMSLFSPQPRRVSLFQPPQSTTEAFEQAQAANRRRQQLDAYIDAERAASRMQDRRPGLDCPPSPDDDIHHERVTGEASSPAWPSPFSNHPSASTMASSSAAEMGEMSQSTSNPSIPSVESGASSLFPEEASSSRKGSRGEREAESSLMSTSETVIAHDRPSTAPAGLVLLDRTEHRHDSDDDGDGSSDDECLTFGKPRQRAS